MKTTKFEKIIGVSLIIFCYSIAYFRRDNHLLHNILVYLPALFLAFTRSKFMHPKIKYTLLGANTITIAVLLMREFVFQIHASIHYSIFLALWLITVACWLISYFTSKEDTYDAETEKIKNFSM